MRCWKEKVPKFSQDLGCAPFLVQTLTGATDADIEAWISSSYVDAEKDLGRWSKVMNCARLLRDFLPEVEREFWRHSMWAKKFPDDAPAVYDDCILVFWAPPMGRNPDGSLKETRVAVKRKDVVLDPLGETFSYGE